MSCPKQNECSTSWTTATSTPTDDCAPNIVTSTTLKSSQRSTSVSASATPTAIPDDACLPQPVSDNIYNIALDTATAFTSSSVITGIANDAVTPIGYKQVFKNKLASVSTSQYIKFSVISLYDPFTCAAECDSLPGCTSFNIFFERDPTLDPGPYCENPPAAANVKCTFWGSLMDGSQAVNTGQMRQKFRVAVAGSNGYTAFTPINGVISAVPAPPKSSGA